jgi:hypothetical protein
MLGVITVGKGEMERGCVYYLPGAGQGLQVVQLKY